MPSTGISHTRRLQSHEVSQGMILWLPTKLETMVSNRQRNPLDCTAPVVKFGTTEGADDGLYNHPMVVISRPMTNHENIHVSLLTSFGGRALEAAGKTNRADWYIPLDGESGSAPHPSLHRDYSALRTIGNIKVSKPGYINAKNVYSMDWRDARPYRGASGGNIQAQLTLSSIEQLLKVSKKLTGFAPEAQHHETFARRVPAPYANLAVPATTFAPQERSPLLAVHREVKVPQSMLLANDSAHQPAAPSNYINTSCANDFATARLPVFEQENMNTMHHSRIDVCGILAMIFLITMFVVMVHYGG